ncbi:alpha/beta fold hydrolase [Streptomyces sp. NPDC048565]|uniref:alpha/beta hydrolase n=1 Tax=Streptomyces sp. NPDC048565 TaxID=3155266 RepID=UPI00341AD3A9
MNTEIEFPSYEGALTLRGTAYVPDQMSGPVPVVIMSHGMADSADRLSPAAQWLADNGFGVILYDHRGFGPSDGEPRQEFDPITQCRDMQMAITFAQSYTAFDPDRVALWGTSFSGGHVLAVAAIDTRVRAVVSQAPWIAGTEIARHILGSEGLAAFREVFNVERRTLLAGGRPSLSPVVRHPDAAAGVFALVDTQEGYDYMISGPAGLPKAWMNSFTTRSLEHAVEFDVRPYAGRIGTTPLLMITGSRDSLIPAELVQEFYDAVIGPKQLTVIDAEHHSLYMPGRGFEESMEAGTRWFATHLMPEAAPATAG